MKIAAIMMNKLSAHMNERGIRLTYSDEVLKFIAEKSYSEKYGARNMRRFLEREVEDKIASLMIDEDNANILGMHLTMKDETISISAI